MYFNTSARHPSQLRMDVSMGLLGIPLGTLTINGEKATLISLFEKKVYVAESGDQVLMRLLKTPLATAEITAIFAERFPLGGGWTCDGHPKVRCTQGDLQVDWEPLEGDQRQLIIDGPKSKVSFVYKPANKGSEKFDLPLPKGYKVIQL